MIRLGQHFLRDESAIEEIVNAVGVAPDDTIIEIGPGRGALTEKLKTQISIRRLADKTARLIAVEKDGALAHALETVFKQDTHVEVIHGDALMELPAIVSRVRGAYKVVGNIPYYITGKLFRTLSELDPPPLRCVFTVQREVAERIAAAPPHMNLLGLSTQAWATPHILRILPPGAFSPPPAVHSAVIALERITRISPILSHFPILKAGFSHPRKLLINNLAEGLSIPKKSLLRAWSVLGLSPGVRAQELSLVQWEKLASLSTVNRP
ncbi:MAG: ribosomal RNA small subunit methyltransferase A [Candidatus Liptonbacteria bacterium]|nr:ribosomal RNA small subunit methyltransferase A [Candidatus Liptonbacteria bacterium]